MSVVALRGATLIDGTGNDPAAHSTVIIEEETITQIGLDNAVRVPAHAQIIDATGLTLLPGLIDCHTHVMFQGANIVKELATPPTLRILMCIPYLRATLDAGFTTARDAGGAPLGVKMALDNGIIAGPRLQICVTALSQTGGHGDHFMRSCIDLASAMPDIPNAVVDGADEVRKRVRQIIRSGADWIKLFTSGGVLSQCDMPTASQFTVEEIEAAVQEGKAAGGIECMAHAQGTQGIMNALMAGVKSIEHGIWLDDDCIELMLARDAYLVPTLIAPVQVIRQAEANPSAMPPWAVDKAQDVVADHARSFRRAVEAGVKIATGTDSGVGPHGENAEELALMTRHGLSPMDTLVATTSRAAELLHLGSRLGSISCGKLADLILVDGNPLDDISVLQDRDRIVLVMKDGEICKDLTRAGVAV